MKPCKTIKSATTSKFVNAWQVQLGNKRFVITPAHVAVHKKEGKWLISKFIKDFKHLDWQIPEEYKSNRSPISDIAWAELSESSGTFLNLSEEIIEDPTTVDFYFRQPYDGEGKWVDDSSFASLNAVLYPSPESKLLEAVDVGFRGMSGAIATKNATTELIGMFVKRGVALGWKSGPGGDVGVEILSQPPPKRKNTHYLDKTEEPIPIIKPPQNLSSPDLQEISNYLGNIHSET